jgi:hypothetical protein
MRRIANAGRGATGAATTGRCAARTPARRRAWARWWRGTSTGCCCCTGSRRSPPVASRRRCCSRPCRHRCCRITCQCRFMAGSNISQRFPTIQCNPMQSNAIQSNPMQCNPTQPNHVTHTLRRQRDPPFDISSYMTVSNRLPPSPSIIPYMADVSDTVCCYAGRIALQSETCANPGGAKCACLWHCVVGV